MTTELKIVKKDGRTVDFRPAKILNDLSSAERVFGVHFHAPKNEIVAAVVKQVEAAPQPLPSADLFHIVENALAESPTVLAAF